MDDDNEYDDDDNNEYEGMDRDRLSREQTCSDERRCKAWSTRSRKRCKNCIVKRSNNFCDTQLKMFVTPPPPYNEEAIYNPYNLIAYEHLEDENDHNDDYPKKKKESAW